MNCRDIGEAGHSTLKGVAGSFAKGLVALPKVVTIPKGKGKGKEKAREEEEEEEKEEEEEEFVKPVQDTFTNMKLVSLLKWRKALMVVDTGLSTGVVLVKAKGKWTVLPGLASI
ncbi:hypothetical protein J132_07991 [Termitomyces sp. J132]|nr:hypothetical protein J132_07991 [Termitomyces sp. J132]